MRLPLLLVFLAAVPLVAQEPGRLPPLQTDEPPLAPNIMPATATGDPDEPGAIRPVQLVVPGPSSAGPRSGPVVVPATPAYGSELPTPAVSLDIEGSEVVASGQPIVYRLLVRNNSRAKAHNVVVKVIPPKGVTKVKAEPAPTHDEAEARWEFKTLEPGASKTIDLAYTLNAQSGDAKIQARVQFEFGRYMVTQVSPPTLEVKKTAPETMTVGDTETCRITLTNTGRVTVRDVEVREVLSKTLAYADREMSRGTLDGRLTSSIDPGKGERTWTIPSIAPGKTETIEYRITAKEGGKLNTVVQVKAANVAAITRETETDVNTANLTLHAEGPANQRGTVGQPAVYRITVENHGSADLKTVLVRCQCPPDMRVVRATQGGDPVRGGVQWKFKDLMKGESKELIVNLTTDTPGTRTIQFSARASRGNEATGQVKTEFAGVPSLDWDIEAPGIATVGKAVTYKVTVANRGTAPGKAKLHVDLPLGFDVRSMNPQGQTARAAVGNEVNFPEFPIPAGKKTTYTLVVEPKDTGEAKAIFTLVEEGTREKREDKVLNVLSTDSRSPTGPPPAGRGSDASKIGMAPRP